MSSNEQERTFYLSSSVCAKAHLSPIVTELYIQNWSNPHTLNGYVMKWDKSNWSQCKMLMVFLMA